MKHRKLRIAWSVAWGRGRCVALCVLWVRSYWCCDFIFRIDDVGPYSIIEVVGSEGGHFYFKRDVQLGVEQPCGWTIAFGKPAQPVHFKWVNEQRSRKIMLPYVFLVPILIALSAIPWYGSFQSRFSLRTLLIATTLVAVVLGLVVYAARSSAR